jgi:hypothetical protein
VIPRAKRLRAPTGSGILEKLRSELYPADEWVWCEQVRRELGIPDDLRIADAIAVARWPSAGQMIHGFEQKDKRGDWLNERNRPQKSAWMEEICGAIWLVIPAPRKLVIHDMAEVPRGWGLIEVGAGGCVVLQAAGELDRPGPPWAFVCSLLAAAARPAAAPGLDTGPRRAIDRPHLSRAHVGLVCGHVAARPLSVKDQTDAVPCMACALDLPPDVEVLEAKIADATPAPLDRLLTAIQGRRCA